MKTPHNVKNMKGFTLVELMVVIGIIAILATMATPSMINLVRKNQLQQETRDFLAVLNEARAEAVLKRATVYLGTPSNRSDSDIVHNEWQPKKSSIVLEIPSNSNTPIAFDFMGRINVRDGVSECLTLRHANDVNVKSFIVLYRQGNVRYLKNATSCP